jgi:hypothetical protein
MLDFGGDAGRRPPREKEADPESSISAGVFAENGVSVFDAGENPCGV